jgi:hypothetical protein
MLAVLWTVWASRERGPVQALETVQEYDRFRAALTAPVPQQTRRRSRSRTR